MTNNTFIKYGIIGVLNTFISYALIFSLFYIGLLPELSNFIGYFVSLFISYFLNKKYNFQSKNSHKKDLPKFILSTLISYLLSLATLIFFYRVLHINAYLSQIFAGIIYMLVAYLLSRMWVFKK